ncbi:questin oxidase family protein [Roseateles sp.]|uniref:questin oxidase family protein n=1 Tax=Roseateles sp. TaxID=1971397 RepID=UPI0039EAB198
MPMKTATPAPATLAQLHHLLDAGAALSPTYRGRLSNHLPMAQQALLELGASAERLQAWSEHHETQLEPRVAARPGRIAQERDLGRTDSEAAWHAHFAARIAAIGAAAALREALPLLLDGAGAIAFHGLIRTAHAVLAGHEGELAFGLAHWAAHYLPLATTAGGPPLTRADWLQALQKLPRPAPGSAAGLISDRMQAWGASPDFAAIAPRLQHGPGTLRDIALLAARTYAFTGNFTVLHLLTGSHAMSVLQPWWPAPELARGFSVAAAAGLLAAGVGPALVLDREPGRSWPALSAAACGQDDAHVIKLVHAAWRLDRRWPDPAWRCAAERAIPF